LNQNLIFFYEVGT